MKRLVLLLSFVLLFFNLTMGPIDWDSSALFDFSGDTSFGWGLYYNRLPRSLLALFTGALFALSGCLMQTTFNNPLAGPTTLGIGSGASLGVALVVMSGSALGVSIPLVGNFIGAFIGAIAFLLILLLIQQKMKSLVYTLIIGLSLGYFSFSCIEFLLSFSPAESIQQYVFWGMGTFNQNEWWKVILIGVLTFSALLLIRSKFEVYNLMLLGDDEMKLSGYNPNKERKLVFWLVGILVAFCVALVGPLAFIGVAIPNAVRMMQKTADHKVLIQHSMLWGGALTLFADWFSRGVVFESVFPVNAILSIISFPLILIFLIRNYRGAVSA